MAVRAWRRTVVLAAGGLLATAAAAWLLTGGAGGSGVVVEQYRGAQPPAGSDAEAVVDRQDGVVRVTTRGSSSCPFEPVSLDASDPAVLVVRMAERGGDCTADLAPTTSVVALPERYRDAPGPQLRLEPASPPP